MNWKDVLERAFWTGVQTPAAVALLDYMDTSGTIPDSFVVKSAAIGFGLSAFKSISRDRLAWLRKKGRHAQ